MNGVVRLDFTGRRSVRAECADLSTLPFGVDVDLYADAAPDPEAIRLICDSAQRIRTITVRASTGITRDWVCALRGMGVLRGDG